MPRCPRAQVRSWLLEAHAFRIAHEVEQFREQRAAAATEAAVKAGARPTISTATLFRHQYPNTLGRYKAYQEQKEWK